jgi:ribose-phosphate pyrophosphokinase
MSVRLNGISVGIDSYPNNERMFDNIALNIKQHGDIANVFVQYQEAEDFEIFTLLTAYINTLPVKEKKLDMWYMPYLRMDRQVGSKDPMIMGIAHIIKVLCADWNVYTLDPHPHLNTTWDKGLHLKLIPVKPFIDYVIEQEKIDAVYYPDEGALQRYTQLFDDSINSKALGFAKKERDINTGRINKIIVDENPRISGKTILMIDDICSYGGTSNAVAQRLKEQNAKTVVAWYSHVELSIYEGRIFKDGFIDRIYTSNSISDIWEITTLTVNEKQEVIEL